jgi:subtilisin family serine protease
MPGRRAGKTGRVLCAAAAALVLAAGACGFPPAAAEPPAGRIFLEAAKKAHISRLLSLSPGEGEFLPGEVVVRLREPGEENLRKLVLGFSSLLEEDAEAAVTAWRNRLEGRVIRLKLRPGVGEVHAAVTLTLSPLVELAEPDFVFRAAYVPDDPRYGDQWNLHGGNGVDASAAWDLQRGSSSNVVAVVDTGIDESHEDLAGRITDGWDYLHGDPDPEDDNGHGTQVAGVICAFTDNGKGGAGIDWYARIMPLKALGSNGEGSLDAVVNSIYHAANHGAEVINMSLTSTSYSQLLADAVEYAHSMGCFMVAAVGNDYDTTVNYPAGLTYVVGVGAVNRLGERAPFSNYNSTVDVTAPGVDILGPLPTYISPSGYGYGKGTSDACPHAAGAALLVLADHPGAEPEEVWRKIRDAARDRGSPGYDVEYGWGVIDLEGALSTPLVNILSPGDYSYPTSGKVSVEAESPHLPVGYLELWVDGDLVESYNLPSPSTSVSHTFNGWDLSQLEEGTHTLTVKAMDVWGGREGKHSVTVYRNRDQQRPSTDWYLAEGSTAWGFETWILVQNPDPSPAEVEVTFMESGGETHTFQFSMAPSSRLTVDVNSLVPDRDVSTHVHADRPVVAERAMYWGGRTGGHATAGVSEGCKTWYLAEGSTAWGFEEYVLVQNPGADTASVTFSFLKTNGETVTANYAVGPYSRFTLNVADVVSENDVSAFVSADRPVVAERAMYWPGGSGARAGGHCCVGSTTAADSWYLAEGSTAWGFEEYVLLANPTDEVVHAALVFMRGDGSTHTLNVDIQATSRCTVYANQVDPEKDVSVLVNADRPVVAERAMYWRDKEGGTCARGAIDY